MTARLAAHAGWRPRTNAIAHWLSLPAQLRIVSRIERFPLSELRATEVGDVLVLGRRQHCWSMLRVVRVGARSSPLLAGAWSAGYDGSHLLIRAVLSPEEAQVFSRPAEDALFSRPAIEGLLNSKSEKAMPDASTPPQTESSSADALARTPVTLEFELGSLTLPLGELANLKPGFVFQLPIKLEDARVVIRAGGRRVGQGELVSVGEVLGVQVTALDGDGLQ
jgi:type III secretion system YscQ/HrcQ family protein